MKVTHFRAPINQVLGRTDLSEAVDLDDFVAALAKQPIDEMDPHWRPQTYNLMWEAIDYSYVGKLEALEPALAPVFEQAGVGMEHFPKRNPGRATDKVDLDAKLVKVVRKIFDADYQAFGY